MSRIPAPGSTGYQPAFKIDPKIGELQDDMRGVEKRIQDAFYDDLFLMISQLDTVRTATEIDARREEKLVMLGPALDRLQREGLAKDISRIFGIMARRGLFPPMPEAMEGFPLKIEYSLLADLQRASATTSIERLWAFAGSISAGVPSVLDDVDADASIEESPAHARPAAGSGRPEAARGGAADAEPTAGDGRFDAGRRRSGQRRQGSVRDGCRRRPERPVRHAQRGNDLMPFVITKPGGGYYSMYGWRQSAAVALPVPVEGGGGAAHPDQPPDRQHGRSVQGPVAGAALSGWRPSGPSVPRDQAARHGLCHRVRRPQAEARRTCRTPRTGRCWKPSCPPSRGGNGSPGCCRMSAA